MSIGSKIITLKLFKSAQVEIRTLIPNQALWFSYSRFKILNGAAYLPELLEEMGLWQRPLSIRRHCLQGKRFFTKLVTSDCDTSRISTREELVWSFGDVRKFRSKFHDETILYFRLLWNCCDGLMIVNWTVRMFAIESIEWILRLAFVCTVSN